MPDLTPATPYGSDAITEGHPVASDAWVDAEFWGLFELSVDDESGELMLQDGRDDRVIYQADRVEFERHWKQELRADLLSRFAALCAADSESH